VDGDLLDPRQKNRSGPVGVLGIISVYVQASSSSQRAQANFSCIANRRRGHMNIESTFYRLVWRRAVPELRESTGVEINRVLARAAARRTTTDSGGHPNTFGGNGPTSNQRVHVSPMHQRQNRAGRRRTSWTYAQDREVDIAQASRNPNTSSNRSGPPTASRVCRRGRRSSPLRERSMVIHSNTRPPLPSTETQAVQSD